MSEAYGQEFMLRAWDQWGVPQVMAEEASRLNWLRQTDYQTFRHTLVLLNGLAGSRPKDEEWDFATERVAWFDRKNMNGPPAYIAPEPYLRDELLEDMFYAAGDMSNLKDIGQMSATVIGEVQAFGDGNRRAARAAYGLAVYGYDGSPESKAMYAAAATDTEPRLHIEFARMHNLLASTYGIRITGQMLYVAFPELLTEFPGYVPMKRARRDQGLGAEDGKTIMSYLNEPYFGMPLSVALIREKFRHPREFYDGRGRLSAGEVMAGIRQGDLRRMQRIVDDIRGGFIRAIIEGYVEGTGPLEDVRALTADCWPVR